MQFQNRIKRVIGSKSGASLVFVLGIMLFLMAIGVSTMAAAAANSGYVFRQSDYSRVRILDESIHDNIMFSLQHEPESPTQLGYQIAQFIFEEFEKFQDDPPLDPDPERLYDILPIELDLSITDIEIEDNQPVSSLSITLSFPFLFDENLIVVNEAIEPVYDDDDDIIDPGVPNKTATMSAIMVVTVEIRLRVGFAGERTVTSRAVYNFKDGRLSDENSNGNGEENGNGDDIGNDPMPGEMKVVTGGWELVRYEVIDSRIIVEDEEP